MPFCIGYIYNTHLQEPKEAVVGIEKKVSAKVGKLLSAQTTLVLADLFATDLCKQM